MKTDFYATYFAVEKHHWLMRVRRKIARDQLTRFAAMSGSEGHDTPTKVLDFGAGAGVLVQELQQGGVDAYGVDMSSDAVTYGTAQGIRNLSVLTPSSPLPFADATFDVVVAMDVLEHVQDDGTVLRELKRVLKPGGTLLITVPAFMFLWGRQDEVSQHFRRYTLGRLVEVVRTVGGFAIVKRSYFNTFLFLPIAIVRVGAWLFQVTGKGSDFEMNNRVLNAILYVIFDIERRMLALCNFPVGVSILLVAKKDE